MEPPTSSNPPSEFQDVKKLVWGNQVKDDLFKRWSQGFVFSPEEPSALVQLEGGPCAIIAPVQAFIFKYILLDEDVLKDNLWRRLPQEQVDACLCKALTDILYQAATANLPPGEAPPPPPPSSPAAKLALIQGQASSSTAATTPTSPQPLGNVPEETSPPRPSGSSPSSKATPGTGNQFCLVFLNEPLSSRISAESDPESMTTPPSIVESNKRLQRPEQEIFHRNLRVLRLETRAQVESVIRDKIEVMKGYYGILQFLYSVILTKGVDELSNEMAEAGELIDPLHGHGSQSLINLMLTGRGVGYVWDNDQDVGGLKLGGIIQPVEVGFLTLLERLRYCEVGDFYKNPKFPVWVIGSETHLTVVFSTNMNLVSPETPAEQARRVFHTFDPDGNNFISAVLLDQVMQTLDLYSDPEYVESIKARLDPETLGIILLNDFMDEFFPNEKLGRPDTFIVYHYNGLPRSAMGRKVVYQEGNAILLETDLRCLSEDNKILTCLQTKWPSIDIHWVNGGNPSID